MLTTFQLTQEWPFCDQEIVFPKHDRLLAQVHFLIGGSGGQEQEFIDRVNRSLPLLSPRPAVEQRVGLIQMGNEIAFGRPAGVYRQDFNDHLLRDVQVLANDVMAMYNRGATTILLSNPGMTLPPAIQRRIVPTLQMWFEDAQFIISTQSPFLISSVSHGFVHKFEVGKQGWTTILPATPCPIGQTIEMLCEDLFDVPMTSCDFETERLLDNYRTLRDRARGDFGDEKLMERVDRLIVQIAERSPWMEHMMGVEQAQLRHQQREYQKSKGEK